MQGTTASLIAMCIIMAIFNGATIKLLMVALTNVDMSKALMEKAHSSIVIANANVADARVPGPQETSYSRVAGMVGSIVLATFYWAVGNVVLYKAFYDPNGITDFVKNLGVFLWAGAAMFLSYAANQLREAFRPSG